MKRKILWALLDLVFVVAFNAIFFVVWGAEHCAMVWCGYGLLYFAYLMLIVTPFLNEKATERHIFGATIYTISGIYFFAEFCLTVALCVLESGGSLGGFSLWFVIEVVATALYLVALVSVLLANDSTASAVKVHESEVAFIKTVSRRIQLMQNAATDKDVQKQLEKLYDLLHSSPSHSSPQAKSMESEITNSIDELEAHIEDTAAALAKIKEIVLLINKRNSL